MPYGWKKNPRGPSLAPSTALGISPAGSDARSPAQLRLRARQFESVEYPGGAALRMTEINILLEYKFLVL
jgi:hypothetical protein